MCLFSDQIKITKTNSIGSAKFIVVFCAAQFRDTQAIRGHLQLRETVRCSPIQAIEHHHINKLGSESILVSCIRVIQQNKAKEGNQNRFIVSLV